MHSTFSTVTASSSTAKSGIGLSIHLITSAFDTLRESHMDLATFRTKAESNRSEEQKLLFGAASLSTISPPCFHMLPLSGLLFSLKGFAEKLSNKEGCVMHSYKTGYLYCLLFFLTTLSTLPQDLQVAPF